MFFISHHIDFYISRNFIAICSYLVHCRPLFLNFRHFQHNWKQTKIGQWLETNREWISDVGIDCALQTLPQSFRPAKYFLSYGPLDLSSSCNGPMQIIWEDGIHRRQQLNKCHPAINISKPTFLKKKITAKVPRVCCSKTFHCNLNKRFSLFFAMLKGSVTSHDLRTFCVVLIVLTVWPFLAKFCHVGKTLKVIGKFLNVFLVIGKIVCRIRPNFDAIWANFCIWKWPNTAI